MPYIRYSNKVLINKGFVGEPVSTADHIRKKRMEQSLTFDQVAIHISVSPETVRNWESGKTKDIPAEHIPRVISFLGYNPEPEGKDFGEMLKRKRRSLGWSTKEAGYMNSVEPDTWRAWEKRNTPPRTARYRAFLSEFLELPNDQLLLAPRKIREPDMRRGNVNHLGHYCSKTNTV